MTLEILDCAERLIAFRQEWKRLVDKLSPATPFQMPEWILTWWRHLGSGRPHVMAFRWRSELVGVIPCFLHEWNGRRQLTLMGSGITDYLDPLMEARHAPAIVDVLDSHLRHFCAWDVCNWQDLSADTPLAALGDTVSDIPCMSAPLGESFDGYLSARPKDLRRNLRRYKEKMEVIGKVRFSVSADAEPALIDALIELHGARWRQAGEVGMIQSNRAAGFVRAGAARMAEQGMIRVFSEYLDDRIVAIVLALRNRTTLYSYLSAFDPEYEQLGFGRELLGQALRYAHEHGYRYWNFMRGDEPYKYSWGARPIPKCRLVLHASREASLKAS